MVMVPPGRIPRLDSVVPVVKVAVPTPVAGLGDAAAVLDDPVLDEDVELLELDEDAELPVDEDPELPCRRLSIPDMSCEFTRCRAWPLAMLARPFPRLVSADCIAEITALVAEIELSWLFASFQ